jgi:hypothetical protein
LFRYLAKNEDRFRVSTMGEAAKELDARGSGPPALSPGVITDLGLFQASVRKAMQLFNSVYWT